MSNPFDDSSSAEASDSGNPFATPRQRPPAPPEFDTHSSGSSAASHSHSHSHSHSPSSTTTASSIEASIEASTESSADEKRTRRRSMSISRAMHGIAARLPGSKKRKLSTEKDVKRQSAKRKTSKTEKREKREVRDKSRRKSSRSSKSDSGFARGSPSLSYTHADDSRASTSEQTSETSYTTLSEPVPASASGPASPDATPRSLSRPALARTKTIKRSMVQHVRGRSLQETATDPIRREIGVRMEAEAKRSAKQAARELADMETSPDARTGWVAHRSPSTPPPQVPVSTGNGPGRGDGQRWTDDDLDQKVHRLEESARDVEHTIMRENVQRVVQGQAATAYRPTQRNTHVIVEPRINPMQPPRVRVVEKGEQTSTPAGEATAREILERSPASVHMALRPIISEEGEAAEAAEKRLSQRTRALKRTAANDGTALPPLPPLPDLPNMPPLPTLFEEDEPPSARGEGTPRAGTAPAPSLADDMLEELMDALEAGDRSSDLGHTAGKTLSPAQWDAFTTEAFARDHPQRTPPTSPGTSSDEELLVDAWDEWGGSAPTEFGDGGTYPGADGVDTGDPQAFPDFLPGDEFTWRRMERTLAGTLQTQLAQLGKRLDGVYAARGRRQAQRLERSARAVQQQAAARMDMLRFAIAELQSDQEHRGRAAQRLTAVQMSGVRQLQAAQAAVAQGVARSNTRITQGVQHLHHAIATQAAVSAARHSAVVDLLEEMVGHTREAHHDIRLFARTYQDQQGIFSELLSRNQQQVDRIYAQHASQTQELKGKVRQLERALDQCTTELVVTREQNRRMQSLIHTHLPHVAMQSPPPVHSRISSISSSSILRSRRPKAKSQYLPATVSATAASSTPTPAPGAATVGALRSRPDSATSATSDDSKS